MALLITDECISCGARRINPDKVIDADKGWSQVRGEGLLQKE